MIQGKVRFAWELEGRRNDFQEKKCGFRANWYAGKNSAGRCFDSAVPRKGAGDLDGE